MMSNYLAEIEPNHTNANSALKVLYIEQLGLPNLKLKSPRNLLEVGGFFIFATNLLLIGCLFCTFAGMYKIVEALSRRFLKPGGYVTVSIKCYLYAGVSKSLLNNFRMYALPKQ